MAANLSAVYFSAPGFKCGSDWTRVVFRLVAVSYPILGLSQRLSLDIFLLREVKHNLSAAPGACFAGVSLRVIWWSCCNLFGFFNGVPPFIVSMVG